MGNEFELIEAETKPIFKPMRAKYSVFGIPAAKFIAILFIAIVGFGLAFLSGNIQHEVKVPYTQDEMQSTYDGYVEVLDTINALETQRLAEGASSYDKLEGLSYQQQEDIEKAEDAGIVAGMTNAQLEHLVATYHTETQPVVPDLVRFGVLLVLPVFCLIIMFIEINRTSLLKEIQRAMKWMGSQKVYKSRPIDYVERETGESYWRAVFRNMTA